MTAADDDPTTARVQHCRDLIAANAELAAHLAAARSALAAVREVRARAAADEGREAS